MGPTHLGGEGGGLGEVVDNGAAMQGAVEEVVPPQGPHEVRSAVPHCTRLCVCVCVCVCERVYIYMYV